MGSSATYNTAIIKIDVSLAGATYELALIRQPREYIVHRSDTSDKSAVRSMISNQFIPFVRTKRSRVGRVEDIGRRACP